MVISSQDTYGPNGQIERIYFDNETRIQVCGSIYGEDLRSICTRTTEVSFSHLLDRHVESVCRDCASNIAKTGVCSELIGTPYDGRDLSPDERRAAECRHLKSADNYANYDKYCVYYLCANEKAPSPAIYCADCQAGTSNRSTEKPEPEWQPPF